LGDLAGEIEHVFRKRIFGQNRVYTDDGDGGRCFWRGKTGRVSICAKKRKIPCSHKNTLEISRLSKLLLSIKSLRGVREMET
jgi:hypothetical protein